MRQQQHQPRHLISSHALALSIVEHVCASRGVSTTLAAQISAFIVHPAQIKRWTIERACEHGFLYLLRHLVSEANIDTHMRPQLYRSHVFSRALAHAVAHDNDLALLECLQTYCPDGFASLGMEAAARVGKLSVMQWLDEHFEPHIIRSSRFAMAAASNGHVDVLKWLATKFRPHPDRLCDVVKAAVASDDLTSVQFLFEQVDHDGVVFTTDQQQVVFESALTAGHFDIVKYFVDERGFQRPEPFSSIRSAILSGTLELVQWLHAQQNSGELDNVVIATAVANNKVDVVRWCIDTIPAAFATEPCCWSEAVRSAGCEVTQLLYAIKPEIFTADFLSRQIPYAAKSNDLALLAWIVSIFEAQNWLSDLRADCLFRAVIPAAFNGYFEVVQFLFTCMHKRKTTSTFVEERAGTAAARSGHVEMVKWLHANRSSDERLKYGISEVVGKGDRALVQWMLEHGDHRERNVSSILKNAVWSGNLALVQWLYAHFDVERTSEDRYVVYNAVKANHVHIVQWLHEQGYGGSSAPLVSNLAGSDEVEWATQLTDIVPSVEMAEWLHWNRTEAFTTSAMDRAALFGNFDVLLFLHAHSSEGCTANAAALAQVYDHQVIVQWLFETYPDIMTAESVMERIRGLKHTYNNEFDKVWFWAPQLKSNALHEDGVKVTAAASK